MQNIGIIAEFNPLHTGHKYLLDKVRGAGNAVTVVMSGNFVQRGDAAVYPKSYRAAAAIKCGADLVLDLPTPYAMSTAQNFAFGAVSLLKNAGVDGICFGSECGDIELLKQTAEILKSAEFQKAVNEKLGEGETFAKIRCDAIKKYGDAYADILSSPNDTLGVEYIYAADRLGFATQFDCIRRIGAEHDAMDTDITVSASLIRNNIENKDFLKRYIPSNALEIFENAPVSDIKRLDTAILAVLRTKTAEELKNLPDISEGIENRFADAIKKAAGLDELYSLIKTKRYTLARVRRLVLSAFLGIDNSFFLSRPSYMRVLGFSKKGEEILREITRTSPVPIILTAADANRLDNVALKLWGTECRASDLYGLSLNQPRECGQEYFHKIIKGEC